MENKSHALWAGFFTIVMLVATVFAGIWFNRDKTQRIEYHIVTSKPIAGLNPQAVVRYKGVAVGRVDTISFDTQVAGQIDIVLSIDPETPITHSTFATLGYQGVTGIAFVQLNDDGSNPVKLTGEKEKARSIPLRPGLFEKLERSGNIIMANAELVSEQLAQLFTSENQQIMLSAFSSTTQATDHWTSIANGLKPALQLMPTLAQHAKQTMVSVQELAQQATQLSQQLSSLTMQLQDPNGSFNQTLANFGELSDRVRSDTLPHITALTNEASYSLRTLNQTLEELKDRPQNLIFGKPAAEPGPGEAGFVETKK